MTTQPTDTPPPAVNPPANPPTAPSRKTTAATVATYILFTAALAVVQVIQGNVDVISALLPPWANVFITPLIPTAITFVTSYLTKHSPQDLRLAVKRRL